MFTLNRIQYTRSPSYEPLQPLQVQLVQVQPVQSRVVKTRSAQIISMRGIMAHQAKSCGACGRK